MAERNNLVNLKSFGFEIHEMVFITEEYLSLDPPVVIDKIRVEKIHTPSLALRREAAQEQHLRILRQERMERMILNTILAAGDILCVQI